jgi:hypothetical protein
MSQAWFLPRFTTGSPNVCLGCTLQINCLAILSFPPQSRCCAEWRPTLPSNGRPPASLARLQPPLTSNVRGDRWRLRRLCRIKSFQAPAVSSGVECRHLQHAVVCRHVRFSGERHSCRDLCCAVLFHPASASCAPRCALACASSNRWLIVNRETLPGKLGATCVQPLVFWKEPGLSVVHLTLLMPDGVAKKTAQSRAGRFKLASRSGYRVRYHALSYGGECYANCRNRVGDWYWTRELASSISTGWMGFSPAGS